MSNNAYDIGASQEAQTNITTITNRLETLIGERDTDVSAAMAEFEATGVSEEYSAKELKWHNAGNEVREIIRLVRTTLETNDGTAQETLSRANAAVQNI
ncbi:MULTISPECIES: pore-forming ESAT-6 family protein [Nocardiopsidaceae]|uniref:Pore-forming ESAT-6 family protein n=2 Tax=Nocardiopsidaceae TaxID=83676 RepID=A0ABY6YMC5_9ACTN|nr:pore-forming ESAT-6 family protein [Streptomonospora nanhaiensis]MEE2045803.1 pore-forming ESAT-6 family protein [Nocardiopsis tropica]WAE73368.1 pore-forming ESAT-6 family protein [Streptomonospora nanhaiensis]